MSGDSYSSAAIEIYAAFRAAAGDGDGIEGLCEQHPELADELRRMHADFQQCQPVLEQLGWTSSFSERLTSLYGAGADPKVTVDEDELASERTSAERYRVGDSIGSGAMGTVYRVWEQKLRRSLAMKVLGSPRTEQKPADARRVARFVEEAQVTGQLDHPAIVPVHDVGLDAEGRLYFTMKLVKGRTLKEVLEQLRAGDPEWTTVRVLGLLQRVCEAMSYAHDKGVIHRDLKPANIMVGRYGEVYVMDWGLARVLGKEDNKDVRIRPPDPTSASVVQTDRREHASDSPDSPLYTMDGDVVGTPAYMPPEQARGDLDALGPPSDVYAVGAMLYELLTGQIPYVSPGVRLNNYAVWSLVQSQAPQRVDELAPDAPGEITAICERAMARDPSGRYASMSALATDLAAYVEGRVVAAYETGTWAETRKWMRRNHGLAASFTGLIVVLIVAVSVTEWLRRRSDDYRAAAETESESRRREAYVMALHAAKYAMLAGEYERARNQLTSCPEDLRGWEWDLLRTQNSVNVSLDYDDDQAWNYGRVVSANGSVLVGVGMRVGEERRTLDVWSLEEGRRDVSWPLPDSPDDIDVDSLGRRVAALLHDNQVVVIDPAGGPPLVHQLDQVDMAEYLTSSGAVRFSRDGSELAVLDRYGSVWTWSPGVRGPVRLGKGVDSSATAFAVDDDLKVCVTGHRDGSVVAWDVENGSRRVSSFDTRGRVHKVLITESGAVVAVADSEVRIWHGTDGDALSVSFSDPMNAIFVAGSQLVVAYAVSFSSSAKEIGRRELVFVDLETGLIQSTLAGPEAGVSDVHFSADASTMFVSGADGEIQKWLVSRPQCQYVGSINSGAWPCQLAPGPGGLIVSIAPLRVEGWDPGLWSTSVGTMANGYTIDAQVSASQEIVSLSGLDPGVVVSDAITGEPISVFGERAMSTAAILDSRLVAVGAGTSGIWDWRTGERQGPLEHVDVTEVVSSDDGRFLLSKSGEELVLWSTSPLRRHGVVWRDKDPEDPNWEDEQGDASFARVTVAYDSASGHFMALCPDGTFREWALGGETLRITNLRTFGAISFAVAPDGERVLYRNAAGAFGTVERGQLRMEVLPVSAPIAEVDLLPLSAPGARLAFRPGSKDLAVLTPFGELTVVDMLESRVVRTRGIGEFATGLCYDPSGQRIVTTGSEIWVLDADTLGVLLRFDEARSPKKRASFVPHGEHVMYYATPMFLGSAPRLWASSANREDVHGGRLWFSDEGEARAALDALEAVMRVTPYVDVLRDQEASERDVERAHAWVEWTPELRETADRQHQVRGWLPDWLKKQLGR
jgi:serine/threonine protein kinase/WD40 repeat protein